MNYKSSSVHGADLHIDGLEHFFLPDILECGQAFRWTADSTGRYHGVAWGYPLTLEQQDDTLILFDTTPEEFDTIWKPYLDLERDYGEIKALFQTDDTLRQAMTYAAGTRVLRQEPWETLCCFILSQNSNIKRIQGMVDRFATSFGAQISPGIHAFPTPESIAALSLEDLAPVRAGFRGKYLLDAAHRVADGTVSLTAPYTLPLAEAREHLMQIKGVGPKVADCVLLFGFSRLECFPKDVWINRVLDTFYPQGFPAEFAPVAGLAQQYLFHFARNNSELLTLEK